MAAKLRATRCSTTSGGGAGTDSFYFPPYFAADEAEVAAVLSRLPDLIRKFDAHRRFLPSWGARRKRSVVDAPPPPVSHSPVIEKLEFASSSPTSPLAFSSHADLDSKLLKKEDGEWLNDCGRSTESIEQLKGEVMKMELFDRLMDDNMKLQVSRQLQNQSVCGVSDSLEVQLLSRSQPLANHMTVGMMQMGPRGIPDLNVPAEEYAAGLDWPMPPQPSSDADHHHHHMAAAAAAAAEYRAGAAALARQRRHLIQKSKRATRGNRC